MNQILEEIRLLAKMLNYNEPRAAAVLNLAELINLHELYCNMLENLKNMDMLSNSRKVYLCYPQNLREKLSYSLKTSYFKSQQKLI